MRGWSPPVACILRFGLDDSREVLVAHLAAQRAGRVEAHAPAIANIEAGWGDELHFAGLANGFIHDLEHVQK